MFLFQQPRTTTNLQVVYRATLGSNQSERSRISLDQSESRIWPMWLIDVTNAHIWAWFDTWPLGIKNTRTQELNLHFWHSFIEKSLVVGRMRSGVQAFALRSHVNEIVGTCAVHPTTPQVPTCRWAYVRVDLLRMRKSWKVVPDPSHPQSQEKAHEKVGSTWFLMDESRVSLVTSGTCVTPEWRHALHINMQNEYTVFAS